MKPYEKECISVWCSKLDMCSTVRIEENLNIITKAVEDKTYHEGHGKCNDKKQL
jgi:hypothetical protein